MAHDVISRNGFIIPLPPHSTFIIRTPSESVVHHSSFAGIDMKEIPAQRPGGMSVEGVDVSANTIQTLCRSYMPTLDKPRGTASRQGGAGHCMQASNGAGSPLLVHGGGRGAHKEGFFIAARMLHATGEGLGGDAGTGQD